MKHKRSVSLRFSLGTAITGMVLITTLFMGTASFITTRNRMRSDLEGKLQVLATSIAAGISALDRAGLTHPSQMGEPVYQEF